MPIAMDKFVIKPKLTDKERYRLTMLLFIKNKAITKVIRVTLYPLIILIVIFTTTKNLSPSGMSPLMKILPFLPLIIMVLFVFLFPLLFIKLKKSGTPTYEFDDWGMTVSNNDKSTNVPWENISEYSESAKYIFIKQSNIKSVEHALPKSEFKDSAELKQFIDLLIKYNVKRKRSYPVLGLS